MEWSTGHSKMTTPWLVLTILPVTRMVTLKQTPGAFARPWQRLDLSTSRQNMPKVRASAVEDTHYATEDLLFFNLLGRLDKTAFAVMFDAFRMARARCSCHFW